VAEEVEMIHRMDAGLYDKGRRRGAVVGLDDIRTLQRVVRGVQMDPVLMRYASELVAVTRNPQVYLEPKLARLVEYGASPRATIAFCRAARALAVLSGRGHVIPDDIAKLAHRILRHRLILGFEAAASGITPETIIDAVLHAVRVP
jgi:MoxR-like ATPase